MYKLLILPVLLLSSLEIIAQSTHAVPDKKLVHKESNMPISYNSNDDGICVYLGYDKALVNSKEKLKRTFARHRNRAIILDMNGKPVRQKNHSALIYRITCLKL